MKGKGLKSTTVLNAEAFGSTEVNWTRSLSGRLQRRPKDRPEKVIMIVVTAIMASIMEMIMVTAITRKKGASSLNCSTDKQRIHSQSGYIQARQSIQERRS